MALNCSQMSLGDKTCLTGRRALQWSHTGGCELVRWLLCVAWQWPIRSRVRATSSILLRLLLDSHLLTRARVAVSATFAMVGGGGQNDPPLTRKLGKLEQCGQIRWVRGKVSLRLSCYSSWKDVPILSLIGKDVTILSLIGSARISSANRRRVLNFKWANDLRLETVGHTGLSGSATWCLGKGGATPVW